MSQEVDDPYSSDEDEVNVSLLPHPGQLSRDCVVGHVKCHALCPRAGTFRDPRSLHFIDTPMPQDMPTRPPAPVSSHHPTPTLSQSYQSLTKPSPTFRPTKGQGQEADKGDVGRHDGSGRASD